MRPPGSHIVHALGGLRAGYVGGVVASLSRFCRRIGVAPGNASYSYPEDPGQCLALSGNQGN